MYTAKKELKNCLKTNKETTKSLKIKILIGEMATL